MKKTLLFFKIYAVFMTLGCAVLFWIIFKMISNKKFDEIDVERINIVEKDGKVRMVISNQLRQHPGAMDGITYDERKGERPPGMIFSVKKEMKSTTLFSMAIRASIMVVR